MKKLFTLIIPMLMGVSALHAQDFPLQFVDAQGNVVADGTVLQLTTVEDLGYGDVQIPAGLFVENKTADEVTCAQLLPLPVFPLGQGGKGIGWLQKRVFRKGPAPAA